MTDQKRIEALFTASKGFAVVAIATDETEADLVFESLFKGVVNQSRIVNHDLHIAIVIDINHEGFDIVNGDIVAFNHSDTVMMLDDTTNIIRVIPVNKIIGVITPTSAAPAAGVLFTVPVAEAATVIEQS